MLDADSQEIAGVIKESERPLAEARSVYEEQLRAKEQAGCNVDAILTEGQRIAQRIQASADQTIADLDGKATPATIH